MNKRGRTRQEKKLDQRVAYCGYEQNRNAKALSDFRRPAYGSAKDRVRSSIVLTEQELMDSVKRDEELMYLNEEENECD